MQVSRKVETVAIKLHRGQYVFIYAESMQYVGIQGMNKYVHHNI